VGSDDSGGPVVLGLNHRQESSAVVPIRRRIGREARKPNRNRRRIRRLFSLLVAAALLLTAAGMWLSYRANQINDELKAAEELIPDLEIALISREGSADEIVEQISDRTGAARRAAEDPVWKIASALPWLGANFSAVHEVAVAADEVILGSAKPLLRVVNSLIWEDLTPVNGKLNVEPLQASSPTIVAAAKTLELSHARLHTIDGDALLPQVAQPLNDITDRLNTFRIAVETAADVSEVLPSMMGADGPRNYLVLVQNNAEIRATGGLPGALAVIRVDNGSIELVKQASGSAMQKFSPPVDVDRAQEDIYSPRLGTYIGDVNLTPHFPTAARASKAMWEIRYGDSIDGVVAIDPVVLAHILEASGPITLPRESNMPWTGLPAALTSENVVPTLLSDVYKNLETNEAQDSYFAAASQQVFEVLASGQAPGPALLKALTRSFEENRVHVWSDHNSDQQILDDIALGGSASGPSVGGAAFGVYFNDGTGAKMDYYVRRTVQLVEVCTNNDYAEYKVRVITANTAPADAATSLPVSVTGDGRYGTPPGSVQTNVVVYGPAMSHADTATADGQKVGFGSHLHGDRPVGIVTTRLAPGQYSEVEMSFVKVVQHNDPTLSVTPTVQDVKDVILPTEQARCE
jgi:hypothetical protein